MTTVGQLIQRKGNEVWSITPDATVYEALQKMADKDVGALLVTDDGKLVGIFSERDYARKLILQGKFSKDTTVADLMTTDVLYIEPGRTFDECLVLMTAKRVRHLPVLEGEKLLGIVTIGDVVKQVISDQQLTIHELEQYITGSGY